MRTNRTGIKALRIAGIVANRANTEDSEGQKPCLVVVPIPCGGVAKHPFALST